MEKPDIIGLGLSTLDILVRVNKMPCWDKPSHILGFSIDGGGPAGTACITAARLGAKVGFIGTAGNDEYATLKLASFHQAGVDLSHLLVRDGPEPHIVIVYVQEDSGERIFCSMQNLSGQPLQNKELDKDYLTSAKYLLLDGSHMSASLQAAHWMHQAGKTVMVDAATTRETISSEMRSLIRETDILISGAGFCEAFSGKTEIWKALDALLESGPRLVVQTAGRMGSYTCSAEGEHFHTPAFEIKVVDTTGAGDVFHGAYLVGLLHGWDLQTIAHFASAVAAIKCTFLGGRRGIPTLAETRDFLLKNGLTLP